MLHKMYLDSSKHFQNFAATNKPHSKMKRKLPQNDYDNWIKIRGNLREEHFTRKAQLKDIANLLKQVLPEPPDYRFESRDRITLHVKRRWVV